MAQHYWHKEELSIQAMANTHAKLSEIWIEF
jgi:hypothetical protein